VKSTLASRSAVASDVVCAGMSLRWKLLAEPRGLWWKDDQGRRMRENGGTAH
jgi:hypothetical protein